MLMKGLIKYTGTNRVFLYNFLRIVRLKKTVPPLSQLIIPLPVKSVSNEPNVGAELTGKLDKDELMRCLAKFYQRREVKAAALENGIDSICIFL